MGSRLAGSGGRTCRSRTTRGRLAAVLLAVACPAGALANCVASLDTISGEASAQLLFPNWLKSYAAAFALSDYGVTCNGTTNLIVGGLTIQNYGTATSGLGGSSWDIAGVYWRTDCDAAGFYHTLTAQGPNTWTWQWNGVETDPNLITKTGVCSLRIYMDVSATPADGATVQLGIPYDPTTGNGGFTDDCPCNVSWTDVTNPVIATIKYVAKTVDETFAAPGDTLHYTIYYGLPGTSPVTNLQIWDTQPPYTHYLSGSSVPAPDVGYDPYPGPPLGLRWTIPGPLATTGGPTGKITFQLTVDWGNGEIFEPGSGDVAAPEKTNLWNSAVATYPTLAASQQVHFSNQARTTVMRYLFWKLADRDLVFSCIPSLCDEITYSLYVKNLSATKTWWNVSIWDTVPAQVDPWSPGYGFNDPCVGWTMTPSGCAAASPGWYVSGGQTILTWKLDMPPLMTLTLQYKAGVRQSTVAGSTAVNAASIMELGQTSILGGTGPAVVARSFTHLAPVVLPTTYVSYVSYDVNSCFGVSGSWYFINFFPLHPIATWQLLSLQGACGLNASITQPAAALPCNAWPGSGCPVGPERRPQYWGSATGTPCAAPQKDLYKLISNCPILWEVNPTITATNQDSMMYITSTTLSFIGRTLYTWRRQDTAATTPDQGDYLGVVNTGNVQTTVHLFLWDPVGTTWVYQQSSAIDPGSQWMTGGTPPAIEGNWRVISSDTDLIVWKGFALQGITDYDNFVTMVPATNGDLTAGAGTSFFAYDGARYGGNAHSNSIMVLTNVGTVTASYQLWRYTSAEPLSTVNAVPPELGGSSGSWTPVDTQTIAATQNSSLFTNPYIYGRQACHNQDVSFTDTFDLYRVDVKSGGPIQVRAGRGGPGRYGGYVLHGLDSTGGPSKSAATFWHSQVGETANDLVVFCPSTGMVVQCTSDSGASATYTTTGPDQPVAFCGMSDLADGCGTNYVVKVLAPAGGRVIGMINGTYFTERHYAAPFLSTGVHYQIQAPPVVFSGQSFWLTVIVLDVSGVTKSDYCGTSTFTSTDPNAKIEGAAMASYDFTWRSSTACSAGTNQNGVRIFFNVSFTKLGTVTLTAADTADGSITGITTVLVVGADIKLFKQPPLAVAASGDTVQFKICWSNYSSASGFTFVINDAVPTGMTYVPEVASALDCGNTDGVPLTVAYSTAVSGSPPASFTTVPSGPLPAGVTWLRWTVPTAGVQTTGCACFRVSIN